jgi:hypothetical protein
VQALFKNTKAEDVSPLLFTFYLPPRSESAIY